MGQSEHTHGMDGAEIINVDMMVAGDANMGNLDVTNFHASMNNCSTGSIGSSLSDFNIGSLTIGSDDVFGSDMGR